MSKNMTRAGVALGSALAMFASTLVGAPAIAAGQADTSFVSLAPTDGESYNVLAIAGQTFSLSANQASSITASGRNVKYLVTDPGEVVEPAVGTTARPVSIAAAATVGATTADVVTLTMTGIGALVKSGSRITFPDGLLVGAGPDNIVEDTETYLVTDATADTIVFTTSVDITTAIAGGTATDDGQTLRVVREPRAANKSFVVDSGVATNTSNKVLVLENVASTATVSVTVTAWVDDNGNGVIDTTEYVSPTRTVTWVRPSTVVPTITWTPVVIGDEEISATVTLSPSINFDQQSTSHFDIDFNRQGSTATLASANARISKSWDGDDEEWTVTAVLKETDRNSVGWTSLKTPVVTPITNASSTSKITHFSQSGTTATFTTDAVHNLSVNDTVTVTTFLASAANAKITAASDLTFSYTTTAAAATTAKTAIGSNAPSVALTAFGFATAGEYRVTAKLGSTPAKIGETSLISAGAQIAGAVTNRATVTNDVSKDFDVRAGFTGNVVVTSSVKRADGTAAPAGTPVVVVATKSSTGTVTVNGLTVGTSRTINTVTDANGQVVLTVTNSSGLNGQTVTLNVSSQGFSDSDTLTWRTAAYALTDRNDNSSSAVMHRSVLAGGTVPFALTLRDQWGVAPTGEFRVKITGAGTRYVSTTYANLSAGTLNYDFVDAPVDVSQSTGTVKFEVEQRNAAGSWVTPNGTPLVALAADGGGEIHNDAFTINIRSANGSRVALNADGVSDADLEAASAATALVAADTRNPGVSANDLSAEVGDVTVTITGSVRDGFSGLAQPGSMVTLTGNSSILFVNDAQASFGTITVIADNNGAFSVDAHSNATLTDSVVTVTSNGASGTVKVSFTGAGEDAGTALTITAPANAGSGTTFQVTVTLTDKFGNGVEVATANRVRVTYTGPGLIVGELPNTTDEDGKLTFSVLLGSNDRGTATVLARYDQNGDGDYVDAKDLSATRTIIIGGGAATTAGKVNVGSFNGKLVVYALGLDGARISWKVAGRWGVANAVGNTLNRFDRPVGAAGRDVIVEIYVDRVLTMTKTVRTR